MTLETIHNGFNAAVKKLQTEGSMSPDRSYTLGHVVFASERQPDGSFVHAITDKSEKVRVSHAVKAPDYKGTFTVAVNGQKTSDDEDIIAAQKLFKDIEQLRVQPLPSAA